MPRSAIEKRLERCRSKVLNNLLKVYKKVDGCSEPFHFHCYDKNGHKFVRVELDEITEAVKEQLVEKKRGMPMNTFIQVHIFERHGRDPRLIDI